MSAHMQRLELQTNPLYCKIFLFSSITLAKWESIHIPCLLSKINVLETGKLIQLLGFSLPSHLVTNNIKQHCTWSHLSCPSVLLSSFRHRPDPPRTHKSKYLQVGSLITQVSTISCSMQGVHYTAQQLLTRWLQVEPTERNRDGWILKTTYRSWKIKAHPGLLHQGCQSLHIFQRQICILGWFIKIFFMLKHMSTWNLKIRELAPKYRGFFFPLWETVQNSGQPLC